MNKILKIFLIVVLLCFLAGIGGAAGLYFWASKDLPGFKKITDYNPPLVTTVYARDNQVLGYFYHEKRFLIRLDQMSGWAPKAFLAAEDASFYEHQGVDLMAILRAAFINFKAGSIKQGGSTITQQIIKRLLLTSEKKYERKLKEAILAYRLEHYLTKDEILTIYLNQIYLGGGAYGVEAAARTYFGRHASDLTLAQSALLAGLPQAPSRYTPFRDPEAAKLRQVYVLDQMLKHGFITRKQYAQAVSEELVYESMADPSWEVGPYYLEEVRRWLVDQYGEDMVYEGGLTVYTACDIKHQKAASAAMKEGLQNSAMRRGWTGPITTLEAAAFERYLLENAVAEEDLVPGAWVKAVVTGVSQKGADVSFGAHKGFISLASMHWCREPNIKYAPEEVKAPTDARKILKVGDVVWGEVAAPDDKTSFKTNPDKKGLWHLTLRREPDVEGALVSMEPDSGEVVAMVGGYSFGRSQFNRAVQAKRQPGSSFKPIVYSVAMDNGFTPASILLDAPIVFANEEEGKLWRPENFEGMFYGPTLLRTALVKSRNLVTIRLAQKLGIKKIIERAKSMGLEAEFPYDLSVALGSASVTLMNMVQAYSAFARGGTYVEPRMVLSVQSAWGEPLYVSEPVTKEAISPQTAYMMATLMKQVVQNGTGWRARVLGRPVAGKTGTTNDEQDAWYMGYSPYLLTGVFVGFDEPRPMGKYETGSRAASPIWVDYRKEVEEDYPAQDFEQPADIVMVRVDNSGHVAGPNSGESYFLPFKAGTEPTTMAPSSSGSSTGSEDDLFKQVF